MPLVAYRISASHPAARGTRLAPHDHWRQGARETESRSLILDDTSLCDNAPDTQIGHDAVSFLRTE